MSNTGTRNTYMVCLIAQEPRNVTTHFTGTHPHGFVFPPLPGEPSRSSALQLPDSQVTQSLQPQSPVNSTQSLCPAPRTGARVQSHLVEAGGSGSPLRFKDRRAAHTRYWVCCSQSGRRAGSELLPRMIFI